MDVQEIERLARELLSEHGLTASGWRFKWDGARARAGVCDYTTRTIGLSRNVVPKMTDTAVRTTVLHEIAHALAGHDAAHGPKWQREAVRLGINPQRCYSSDHDMVEELDAPWVGTCPSGHRSTRHRRPVRVASCNKCAPRFDKRFVISWKLHGRVVPMDPRYVDEYVRVIGSSPAQGATVPVQRVAASAPARRSVVPSVPLIFVGETVRVRAQVRKIGGMTGRVEKVGRSRYHVRINGLLWAVSFSGVERVS